MPVTETAGTVDTLTGGETGMTATAGIPVAVSAAGVVQRASRDYTLTAEGRE